MIYQLRDVSGVPINEVNLTGILNAYNSIEAILKVRNPGGEDFLPIRRSLALVLDALAPIPVGNYHPRICWELPSSLEIDLLGDGILNPEFKVIWYAGVIEWDPEGYDLLAKGASYMRTNIVGVRENRGRLMTSLENWDLISPRYTPIENT